MSEPKLVTENNVPNVKLVTGGLVSLLGIGIAWYLSSKGIVIPQDSINEQVLAVMGGIWAIRNLIEYLKKPRKGDGVKPKE